jgi:hypothetical protein
MKIFLFDEVGDLIKYFACPADCAKAIGSKESAVRTAALESRCLMGRYYVARVSKLPPLLVNKHSHNLILNFSAGNKGNRFTDNPYQVTSEQLAGLELLADSEFNFDKYLFGNLPLQVEQPESFFPPDRLSKWNG